MTLLRKQKTHFPVHKTTGGSKRNTPPPNISVHHTINISDRVAIWLQLFFCDGKNSKRAALKVSRREDWFFHSLDLVWPHCYSSFVVCHYALQSHKISNTFVQNQFIQNSIFQYISVFSSCARHCFIQRQQHLTDINFKYIFGERIKICTYVLNTQLCDQHLRNAHGFPKHPHPLVENVGRKRCSSPGV